MSALAVGAGCPRCNRVEREEPFIGPLTKITRVVIVALALYVQTHVAALAFGLGLALGALVRFKQIKFDKGESMPVCITGYLELCTGFKLPAIARTLFTAAFLTDCVMRGSPLFVGIITSGIGFSVGYNAPDFLRNLATAASAA